MKDHSNSTLIAPSKLKVSWPLFWGIVFLPFIFGWKLLNRDYSIRARLFTFAWATLYILTVLSVGFRTKPTYDQTQAMPFTQCLAYRDQLIHDWKLTSQQIKPMSQGRTHNVTRLCTPSGIVWINCNAEKNTLRELHFSHRFDDDTCNKR